MHQRRGSSSRKRRTLFLSATMSLSSCLGLGATESFCQPSTCTTVRSKDISNIAPQAYELAALALLEGDAGRSRHDERREGDDRDEPHSHRGPHESSAAAARFASSGVPSPRTGVYLGTRRTPQAGWSHRPTIVRAHDGLLNASSDLDQNSPLASASSPRFSRIADSEHTSGGALP